MDTNLTGGKVYSYNYVTVDGMKENSTYYYSVEKNGVRTPAEVYKTGSFSNVNILYVGDPQVGASKGQPQGEGKLSADPAQRTLRPVMMDLAGIVRWILPWQKTLILIL